MSENVFHEKLVAGARWWSAVAKERGQFGKSGEGERPPLEAVTTELV
jgi:hypothetical protein